MWHVIKTHHFVAGMLLGWAFLDLLEGRWLLGPLELIGGLYFLIEATKTQTP